MFDELSHDPIKILLLFAVHTALEILPEKEHKSTFDSRFRCLKLDHHFFAIGIIFDHP